VHDVLVQLAHGCQLDQVKKLCQEDLRPHSA
jgi:hypothetical protein